MLFHLHPSIDDLTPGQLYKKFVNPELERITRLENHPLDPCIPTHGAIPIWLGEPSDIISLTASSIFLGDFGDSFQPASDVRRSSHTPFVLRALGLLLDRKADITFATEIWSLACALFGIMGQRALFESWFPSSHQILEAHVDHWDVCLIKCGHAGRTNTNPLMRRWRALMERRAEA